MMKYMDKTISKREAEGLKAHAGGCKACRDDLELYNDMLRGFEESEIFSAPAEFCSAVMDKLESLEHSFNDRQSAVDNFLSTVFGVLSLVLAVSFMLITNREQILGYMDQTPSLAAISGVIRPFSALVESFWANLSASVGGIFASIGGFLSDGKYVFAGLAVLLIIVQFVIIKRRKPENESEAA